MSENVTTMELEPKKSSAITALLEYRTIEEASISVEISSRTLYRWMNEPSFQMELRNAETELVDTAMRRLLRIAIKAVDALENIIDNPDQEGASNKRMASQNVIDNLLKLRELHSVERRISELERVIL